MSKFLHTHQYLKKYCKKLTKEEAQKHLDEGTGYIGKPGYTFCNPSSSSTCYFASGSFPGCIRGGLVSADQSDEWYLMTLKDIICTHGFYPDPYMMSTVAIMQNNMQDFEVHLDDLIKYCIDSGIHSADFKHPMRSPKIWQEYFSRKGMLDEKESSKHSN